MDRIDRIYRSAVALIALSLGACTAPQEQGDDAPPLAQEASSSNVDDSPEGDIPGLTGPRDLDRSGCKLPTTCTDVRSSGLNLNACCTKKLACGLDLSPLLKGLIGPESGIPQWLVRSLVKDLLPPGTDLNAPCVTGGSMWMPTQSLEDQRVIGSPEADVVLAKRCPSRMLVGFPIYGCCMPDNRCGYSTHYPLSDLRLLSLPGAPKIEHAACVTASGVDAVLKQTKINQFIGVPPTSGTCNYKALYDSLPPAEPVPE